MTCKFCDNPQSAELKLKIRDYECWSVFLWMHPYYLGRCFVKLNRHAEDFFDINEDEQKELFKIVRDLRSAIRGAFGAEMFNYATLGNIVRHVHLHVIPRYSNDVSFGGIIFKDERWGKNYAPYDKNFDVPKEIKEKICEEIKLRLSAE